MTFLDTLLQGRAHTIGHRVQELAPGVMLALIVALAATFLGQHYGAPVMLFGLLLGLAMHSVADTPACAPGLAFSAKHLLRLGIVLLGARITTAQVVALGWQPLVLVVACMSVTIGAGLLAARLTGRHWSFGMLTGGAVAICGASAALALSSVLPDRPEKQQTTVVTVVAVTALSTLAMILYPILFLSLGFEETQVGVLLGATIHDVAQVVGAGYGISQEAGDTASLIKLIRVALMPVVIVAIILLTARGKSTGTVPWPLFTLGFLAVMGVNSLGWIPEGSRRIMEQASGWLLLSAIAALGMKTSLKALADVGMSYVKILVLLTGILLGAAVLLLSAMA